VEIYISGDGGHEIALSRRRRDYTMFPFNFLLKLLEFNLSHQMFFLHMAPIHAINDLNGDIIKWRKPELLELGRKGTLVAV
jgi:hypothetical protein